MAWFKKKSSGVGQSLKFGGAQCVAKAVPLTPENHLQVTSESAGDEAFKVACSAITLHRIFKRLLGPFGCPWDREQTFASLRKYLIEEAYEASNAAPLTEMDCKNKTKIDAFVEELGDVLLQVYLNAQIGADKNLFDVCHVYGSISKKMLERHPHVFTLPDSASYPAARTISTAVTNEQLTGPNKQITAQDVVEQWNALKAVGNGESLFRKASKKSYLPTLEYLCEISQRSFKLGFCWGNLQSTFADLRSEVEELFEALCDPVVSQEKIEDELGDIIYSLANVVVFVNRTMLKNDTQVLLDQAARLSAQKFLRRFAEMELIQKEKGQDLTEEFARSLSLEAWNALWKEAKSRRYK